MRLRPLFTALALVVAGILSEPLVGGSVAALYGIALLCLLLALARSRSPRLAALALLLPFFLIAVGRTRLARMPPSLASEAGRYRILTGRVDAAPEPTRTGGLRFAFQASQARILVTLRSSPPLHAGDLVTVRGRLELPPTATNPGEFDYRAYLKRQGVFLVFSARSAEVEPQTVSPDAPRWLRATIHSACYQHLPADDAALLAGLLISDRSRFPVELNEAFLRTGTVHILSTSGLHLSLLALLVSGFLRRLFPRQSLLRVAISLALIAVYALAAGGGGAVTRSAVMVGIFLIAPLVRREPDPLHSLALAALLIFLASPLALFDPGTQLSVATVCTLVLWYKTIERLVWPWEPSSPGRVWAARWALLGLCVGVVAQLGSWLLVAYHFNSVSWIAPLANLLIAPVSEVLLVLGLLAVALSGVPLFGTVLWTLCGLGLHVLKALALALAALPFAASSIASPSLVLVLGWYLVLLLPARAISDRLRKARFVSV